MFENLAVSYRKAGPAPPPSPDPEPLPDLPTADMIGIPTLTLPNEVTAGETASGSVSLPTFGALPYYFFAGLWLVHPTGSTNMLQSAGRIFQPGETIAFPVQINTFGFTPGVWGLFLRVQDENGTQLAKIPVGSLTVLKLVGPISTLAITRVALTGKVSAEFDWECPTGNFAYACWLGKGSATGALVEAYVYTSDGQAHLYGYAPSGFVTRNGSSVLIGYKESGRYTNTCGLPIPHGTPPGEYQVLVTIGYWADPRKNIFMPAVWMLAPGSIPVP